MGNCIALNISCDDTLNRVCGCFCGKGNYIYNLKENLKALEEAMEDLKARRDDVLTAVQIEEDKGLQRLQQVQVWLSRVLAIENSYSVLTNTSIDELERLCLGGVASKSLKKSYIYGQRVFLMWKEVNNLKSNGVFETVAKPFRRDMVEERPLPPKLVAREVIMERAWNNLMNDGTWMMGIYGMGGVGKTSLLTQINNKLYDERQVFDFVIWVDVSRDKQIEKIQDDIAEKLAFSGDEWRHNTKSQKASEIFTFLREKKFVLLLDDLWEKVDLLEIGIPFPTKGNRCKVVFTSRSREVCGHMGVDDPMEVQCLEENEAWIFFQRKVGEKTLSSHPDITNLARKVAAKCHGLPLALNVIGETMSCKTSLYEWKHAIDVLTSYAREFSGMEEYILPVLKYSYDSLRGEHVKSCFQFCALFSDDRKINKEALIEYWICEGFVDGENGRERAINQGYEIIGTLVRACLLVEDINAKSNVKMHNVVREMAMWIASDHKEKCIVQAGAKVHDVPQVRDWNSVGSMSLMSTNIKEISGNPNCPQLTTLLLQTNYKLVSILGEFFMSMPILAVLDLSMNYRLDELPEEISYLVSLRFLDLSYTCIGRLPVGMQKLKKLLHLNLESMQRLESVSGISNFSSLRLLKLLNSSVLVDNTLIEELQRLEYLETLTMKISSWLVLEKLFCAHKLVKCIQKASIVNLQEESFEILSFPTMDSLNSLTIWWCKFLEIKMESCTSWNKNPTSSYFSNLSYVWIRECYGLRDLTWLLFAPNLIDLNVGSISRLEYIICKERIDHDRGEEASIITFQKLKYLSLINLPALKSIYWSPLCFPSLKRIKVQQCLELRKLPLDSKSGVVGEELVIHYGETEWIESVKWEDEATRLRFLSSSYTLQKEMPIISSADIVLARQGKLLKYLTARARRTFY